MEQTQKLAIDGMTCGGCSSSVTRVLLQVPGVSEAQVSLAEHSAVVRFDPARTSAAKLIEAVENAGFSAAEG